METNAESSKKPHAPLPVPFFYGWVIVGLTFFAVLNSAGIRVAPQLLIKPLEGEFGWNRAAISLAVSINLILYGAASPVTGWLMDRFGPRRVMLGALAMLTVGLAGTTFVQELWQFILLWGVVIGLGAGGMSSILSATVAHRWFTARRGLVLGILNSANSTGQLIFLPLMMGIIVVAGWRVNSLALAGACIAFIILVSFLMIDDPTEVGLEPFNQGPMAASPGGQASARGGTGGSAPVGITQAIKTSTFWLLCGCFFVCGGTANGLVGTHLIPHALDRGFEPAAAAWTVAVMGGMNFVGTLTSGYLTDRMDSRKLLAAVFALRGVSLFILPYVTGFSGLVAFAMIYGLDWFATVAPVIFITGETFGKQSIGRVYGWIFLSHQIGGAVSATGAGLLFSVFGDYEWAFLAGGVMGLMAAVMALSIRLPSQAPPLYPQPTGVATA
jgi:MFS family permease